MKRMLILVIVLLIGSVGSASVTAEMSPSDEIESGVATFQTNVQEECVSSNGPQVYTQTGTQINEDEPVALYPQTELTVFVCQGGNKIPQTDWEFENTRGFDTKTPSEGEVSIEVTNPDAFDLSIIMSGGDRSNPNFKVTELEEATYQEKNTDILGVTLLLQGSDVKSELDRHLSALDRNRTALQNKIDELENQPEVSEDSSVDEMNKTVKQLHTLRTHYQYIQQNIAEIEAILYEQTNKTAGYTNMTTAMSNLQAEQEEIAENTNMKLAEKNENLEKTTTNLRMSIATNIGLGAIVGIVFGFVIGAIQPYRKGKKVRDFYQVSSQNRLTTDVLKVPVILGLLLLIGGIVAMAWSGILEVLI